MTKRQARMIAAAHELLEALIAARLYVRAAAEASHFLDGFEIGPDGLPISVKSQTGEDRVLACVEAAITKAEGA